MNKLWLLRVIGIGLLSAGVLFYWVSTRSEPPSAFEAPAGPVYHTDPDHLWNRLYEGLCVRTAKDGTTLGRDRLEPLLWLGSKHLLEGQSHERALELLNEFLKVRGETLIDDPLKRAVFQRDLWMVSSWLEGMHTHNGESGVSPEQLNVARKRLGPLLAVAIRRLAMSPEEIENLPDNYSDAIKSGSFAETPAGATPGKPYLPPDLFSNEAWVSVGREEGPVAMRHLAPENTLANSAFLIFLKLPGGRDAVSDFLKEHSAPLPAGAEVALVRQALLIASPAEIVPTKLTESVQLRIYGQTQVAVSEFRLSRGSLIAGEAGGLRAVGAEEWDFKTGFAALPWDPFEDNSADQTLDVHQVTITKECLACHNPERSPGLQAQGTGAISQIAVGESMRAAVKWKRESTDWKTLRKLLADKAPGTDP